MAKSRTPKFDIRLLWKTESRKDSMSHIESFTGQFVYVDERGEVKHFSRNSFADPGSEFADLTILAQRNLDENASSEGNWYAMRATYREVWEVNLRDAEIMVKFLRGLDRKLAKLDEQFGRATDLAGFCARVMQAVGASDPSPYGRRFNEMQINGTNYRWTDVEGFRSHTARRES